MSNIEKEASSRTINKWTRIICEETDIVAEGNSPTERIESVIERIKELINNNATPGNEMLNELNQLIGNAFNDGVQCGFQKALSKFTNGSIKTRKNNNEDSWALISCGTRYQITYDLPSANGGNIKETVFIKLSDFGFE